MTEREVLILIRDLVYASIERRGGTNGDGDDWDEHVIDPQALLQQINNRLTTPTTSSST